MMNLGKRSWLKRGVPLLLWLLASVTGHGGELQGTVVEVTDTSVKIRVADGQMPGNGDKVQIGSEVPDVGFVALEGAWLVTAVEGEFVRAEPEGAKTGKPLPGLVARIIASVPIQRATPSTGAGTPTTRKTTQANANEKTQAEQPSAQAQAEYERGLDFSSKGLLKEAVASYRRAAEAGHIQAQSRLANCYAMGQGVEKDSAEAVAWYRKAAEKGDAVAQANMGVAYTKGWGVAADPVEGVRWYHKAAEQGLAGAMNHLGTCYSSGVGVAKDPTEAVRWYRKAAEQGLADAMNNLGTCYFSGEGVSKGLAEATRWYRAAAEKGDACAQYNLARCYITGMGVTKDPVEAMRWYRKAAEQRLQAAQDQLAALSNEPGPPSETKEVPAQPKPRLGVMLGNPPGVQVGQQLAPPERGALVKQVHPDSEAEKAGLLAGDCITAFDSQPVTDAAGLGQLIREAMPGKHILTLRRRDEYLKLPVRLAE